MTKTIPGKALDARGKNDLEFRPHALPAQTVADVLGVEIQTGLSEEEAAGRFAVNGANKIEQKQKKRLWKIFLDQFASIVVYLLAFAAAVAFLTGNGLEAAAILAVLLINATIGFVIEWRARQALEALEKATRTTARVRRGGHEHLIDAENLVVGDIVILSAGDRVPADARVLNAANLQADESTLTGESVAVEKDSEPVEPDAPLAVRRSMLYFGTTVVTGSGLAVVTATGKNTEIGRIGQLVAEAEEGKTPLEKRLADLGKRLVYAVLVIAAVVFLAGFLRGDKVWLMLEISISLAVAAVPEGLPAVTTLILALGVLKMARSQAIVRKLSAVETLGGTTVICTDKTGTLTENRMTVREYGLANGRIIRIAENDHYDSVGETGTYPRDENLLRLLRVSVCCNDASLDPDTEDGEARFIGDPTETALLAAVEKFGFDVGAERSCYEKIKEDPFDSATKRMITVMRESGGRTFAAVKGAPGVILNLCEKYFSETGETVLLTEEKRREFLKVNEEMAGRALRVLAFADKDFENESDVQTNENIESGYTFLGFVGMSDPPREGAAEAVRQAQTAGVRVVMMTGDQLNTARAVARELGLGGGKDIYALNSSDLAGAAEENLAAMARQAQVFARVTPEDKMRIVKALQAAGETVAVTGDGVNDAPALKHADIGIAMGKRGTEAAKEASDIVLTDDNFKTLVKAIESGRAIYSNIIKFVNQLFSDNLTEILVIFAAIMAGLPLPFLPLQILWINLVTDVFPALALALEPASPEAMRRPPRPPSEALLSGGFMFLIFWKAVLYAAIVLGAYYWALAKYGEGAHARTVVLLSLVAVQAANLFNSRSRSRSAFDGFFSNPYIFAAVAITIFLQFLALYFPPLAGILDTAPPQKTDYAVILAATVLPVVIVEIFKARARRKKKG